MKGNAAIIMIVIIVVGLVVLVAFPGVIGGFSLGGLFGGGGNQIVGAIGQGSQGVVITSFLADPVVIPSGEEVFFTLTAVNKGTQKATNVKYEIFGLDDSNSWSGKSVDSSGEKELLGIDTVSQREGMTTQQVWTSTSKEKKVDITYPVTARVEYDYKTSSAVVLNLYKRSDVDVKGTTTTGSGAYNVQTDLGPISVTPKGTIPLIGKNTKDFTLSFDIANIGGGRTFVGNKDSGLDKIKITADGCSLTSSSSDVKLINGRRTVSCKVTPNLPSDGPATHTIDLEIEYSYVIEGVTSVRVQADEDE